MCPQAWRDALARPGPQLLARLHAQDIGYRASANRFPYNLLRNAALARCEADYVFAADVDFVPYPAQPSARLRRWLTELDVAAGSPNVLVVAAFEQVGAQPSVEAAASMTKRDLIEFSRSGDVISFASATYESGHVCDEPATFLATEAPYETSYRFGCEPYTIVPRVGIHQYDERFVGYGKDRVSWNYELAARRPSLRVVPDVFLIHFNTFSPNASRSKYGHFPRDWMIGETCWAEFRERVQARYNYSEYTCKQRKTDGLVNARYGNCITDQERVCVAPHCSPPITVIYPAFSGAPRRQSIPARPYSSPPQGSVHYPGPSIVILGCEGCGAHSFWRVLKSERDRQSGGRLRFALTARGEPAWRERSVQFGDREAKFGLGRGWYLSRWPIVKGSGDVGVDGSATYLHSSEAALRIPPLLPPRAILVVILADPATRAARMWDGERSFPEQVYAETTALLRCFEDANGLEPAAREGRDGNGVAAGNARNLTHSSLSHAAWDRCVATVCGPRSCVVGGGAYAPQLSGWLDSAPGLEWLIVPAERLVEDQVAKYALSRLGMRVHADACPTNLAESMALALDTTLNQTEVIIRVVQSVESERRARPNAPARVVHSNSTLLAAAGTLRVFFHRYNAPLAELVEHLDPRSASIWKRTTWYRRHSVPSVPAVSHTASILRSAITSTPGCHPESGAVGSRRWLGPGPKPTAFLLGARESGAEALASAILVGKENGTCGGALRLFDDDVRYAAGLARAVGSLRRGVPRQEGDGESHPSVPCSRMIDSTAYLHTRWAPVRMHAALSPLESLRFVIVLRDPADRVTRHWRSIRMTTNRRSLAEAMSKPAAAPGWPGRAAEPLLRHERTSLLRAGGNVTMYRKVHTEVKAMGDCLSARLAMRASTVRAKIAHTGGSTGMSSTIVPPLEGSEPSHDEWRHCMTTQCNWLECLVGTGLYAPQLRGWLAHFSPEQMLLLEASQLTSEPRLVAQKVEAFLHVPPFGAAADAMAQSEVDSERTFVTGKQALSELRSFYAPHNGHVRRLFEVLAPPGAWQSAVWLQPADGASARV